MTQTQGRDDKGRFLPTTSPEEARIAELETLVKRLEVSNANNAAEFTRCAESLRLAEQGRNEALKTIEECRSIMAPYMTGDAKRDPLIRLCSASAVAMSRTEALAKERNAAKESEKKAHELLSSLTTEVEAQKALKRTAEGRYVALHRQRTGEWLIVMTVFTLIVSPAVFIAGRLWGMR
jgi:Mg2+ and Co2+ transporter CorA